MTTQPAVSATPTGQSESIPAELEGYNSFIETLQVTGIELIKLQGERTTSGAAAQTRFNLTAGYTINDDVIQYRYDINAHFVDDSGSDLGNAAVSAILVVNSEPGTDMTCIERFGATSAALMVHPYLREAIASTAQRIGFPGVFLPMIKYRP